MTDKDGEPEETAQGSSIAPQLTPIVVRSSNIPVGLPYNKYRLTLRYDFWYSCAYCTIMESEAQGLTFHIDHYLPRVLEQPDVTEAYGNLMYACEECNALKGDRIEPEAAREAGHRFFRVDADIRSEHFRLEGDRIHGQTNVGKYTAAAIDLNRPTLTTIRSLRQRLLEYDGYVSEGIGALVSFAIDRLDPKIRVEALRLINEAVERTGAIYDNFDALLRAFAKSRIIPDGEPDGEEIERNKDRLAKLKQLEGIYPGAWRGRKARKKRH